MVKTFSYNKKEKLKSRKLMETVFKKGKTFSVYPVKVFFIAMKDELDFPVKLGVGVSSRNFKKAVMRNRIKRLLREAYRTEKLSFHQHLATQNKQVVVFLLYVDRAVPDYNLLKTKMPVILDRLIKHLNEAVIENT